MSKVAATAAPAIGRSVLHGTVQKYKSTLDAISLFQERVGVRTRLAVGRVIVYKSGGVDKTGGPTEYTE